MGQRSGSSSSNDDVERADLMPSTSQESTELSNLIRPERPAEVSLTKPAERAARGAIIANTLTRNKPATSVRHTLPVQICVSTARDGLAHVRG
jgi:hypothetical protein